MSDNTHPTARLQAMCRLLEPEGHMTPIATQQIMAIFSAPPRGTK